MNSYEVTIVLPTGTEDKEVLTRLEKEVKETGGKIEKSEEWGERELAYAIKKHGGPVGGYREGVYHYFEVALPAERVGDINRFLETNEAVLRHLLVKIKNQKSKVQVKSQKVKKVVKKRNGNKKSE